MSRSRFVDEFQPGADVLARLDTYVALLQKWSVAINLFGPTDTDQIWFRHIHDSAQIVRLVPDGVASWADLGTGAGFPGLVAAIMLTGRSPAIGFDLIDSDQRKAAFLRETARQTGTQVDVIVNRTEDIPESPRDIVTCRAFAPLTRLLPQAARFAGPGTLLLLHKGRNVREEIAQARESWDFSADLVPSTTDPDAAILRIRKFSKFA